METSSSSIAKLVQIPVKPFNRCHPIFNLIKTVVGVVLPSNKIHKLLSSKKFKPFLLQIDRVKPVLKYPPHSALDGIIRTPSKPFATPPDLKLPPLPSTFDKISPRMILTNLEPNQKDAIKPILQEMTISPFFLVDHTLFFDYGYWSPHDALIKYFNSQNHPETSGVSSYEISGSVVHLNLREQHWPFKSEIGQILLEKVPAVKSIVNKIGEITNEFRVFDMELLAGDPNLTTQVTHINSRLKLDFRQVYWNSRLHHEHEYIFNNISPASTVADMMAGIGPFAIPLGKKGCTVYANDLNPHSFYWLQHNAELNKVQNRVHCFNFDGKEFIDYLLNKSSSFQSVRPKLGAPSNHSNPDIGGPRIQFDHVLMNLPASAPSFLSVFNGAWKEWSCVSDSIKLPRIHCYSFSKADDIVADGIQQACKGIGVDTLDKLTSISVRSVRSVAPKKDMICIEFNLPKSVAFGTN